MPVATPSPSNRPGLTVPNHQKSTHRSSRIIPYSPDLRELHPGAKNRLFLSLRSSVDSEIDWALPRLVVASFEHPEHFRLETWVDSVGALQAWPEIWVEELEREAALLEVRDGLMNGAKRAVLGVIPEWTRDPSVETRAIHSLLVLRNASLVGNNAKIICRATFLAFLARFFALPVPFLLELTLRSPEAVHHLLVILQSIVPHLHPTPPIHRVFATVLPNILIDTRDLAMLNLLLPLLNASFGLPNLPSPPATLVPHLLDLLSLEPPPPLLELTLDLLISLTILTPLTRAVLALPTFPAHLKTLVILLEHDARSTQASWDAPGSQSLTVRNPAGGAIMAEEASRRRTVEREAAQRHMEIFGGPGVFSEVGDKPPIIGHATRNRLYALAEPQRAIAWSVIILQYSVSHNADVPTRMHESFVYCSTSQLLQVTFWHAYREFIQHSKTVHPLLSASEVIKSVTVAFPGASAKVRTDPAGQRFVVAGIGFRKSSGEAFLYHRFPWPLTRARRQRAI